MSAFKGAACTAARAAVVLAVASLALAGCAGRKDTVGTNSCPGLIAAPGADAIVLFGPGGHERNDVLVAGKIYNTDVKCQRMKPGVDIFAEIQFYAERANLQVKDATLPYFVALVDPLQHVLTQESYEIRVQFVPGDNARRMPAEKLTIHLPVRDPTTAGEYSLVVGFQLTPDQLAFNRAIHGR